MDTGLIITVLVICSIISRKISFWFFEPHFSILKIDKFMKKNPSLINKKILFYKPSLFKKKYILCDIPDILKEFSYYDQLSLEEAMADRENQLQKSKLFRIIFCTLGVLGTIACNFSNYLDEIYGPKLNWKFVEDRIQYISFTGKNIPKRQMKRYLEIYEKNWI